MLSSSRGKTIYLLLLYAFRVFFSMKYITLIVTDLLCDLSCLLTVKMHRIMHMSREFVFKKQKV